MIMKVVFDTSLVINLFKKNLTNISLQGFLMCRLNVSSLSFHLKETNSTWYDIAKLRYLSLYPYKNCLKSISIERSCLDNHSGFISFPNLY